VLHQGTASNLLVAAAALSDHALLAHVQALAVRERLDSCELIAHLAVLDTRKVLVAEGHSLFTCCTVRLGLTEDAAYTRVRLTAENHQVVLQQARRRSKREIERLVAQLSPRPDVPSTVRKLPAGGPALPAGRPRDEPPPPS
jgi:hypothetical protein